MMKNSVIEGLLEDECPIIRSLAQNVLELKASESKLRNYKKDALRYRWLRDTNGQQFRGWNEGGALLDSIENIMVFDQPDSSVEIDPLDFDEAVDFAMKKWPA